MIWLYEGPGLEPDVLGALSVLLSEARRAQMMHYKFHRDRVLCLLAFALLRLALYREYRIKEMPEVLAKRRQKPVFQTLPLHFNLSHCNSAAVCALSAFPVGVDVQQEDKQLYAVRGNILTETEQRIAGDRLSEITRFWTLKEAYGKYSGRGLCYPYQKTDFSAVHDVDTWQAFGALCVLSRTCPRFGMGVFAQEPLAVCRVTQAELTALADVLREV